MTLGTSPSVFDENRNNSDSEHYQRDEYNALVRQEIQDEVEALALPDGMPPADEYKKEYDELVQRIATAKDVAQQADLFATALDTYGIDTALGMIPVVGDIAGSLLGVVFLLYGQSKTKLSKADILKILGVQTLDAGLGSLVEMLNVIPGLGTAVGLALDQTVKAHRYTSGVYTEHLETLINQVEGPRSLDRDRLMKDVDEALLGKGPPQWLKKLLQSKKFKTAIAEFLNKNTK